MPTIKYRTHAIGLPPRKIKLEVPGWSGDKDQNSQWRCLPWCAGATYGLELIYPFDTEITVTSKDGISEFHYENWTKDLQFPFKNFAPNHFGFTSLLDINPGEGMSTMILPHPRYYTDSTGNVPLAIQGMLTNWWSKIFFIVFKAPLNNQEYIFKKGDGIAQFIFVPSEVEYDIQPMSIQEARNREMFEVLVTKHEKKIATKTWKDADGNEFDNKYKVLSMLDKKGELNKFLNKLKIEDEDFKKTSAEKRKNKMKRRLL